MQIELWFNEHNFLGEGPIWYTQHNKLYWVDITRGQLHTYDPATKTHEKIYEDRSVGGYTIQPDGSLILFRDKGNVVQWANGKVVKTLIEQVEGEVDGRFNDVIAAPCGRVAGRRDRSRADDNGRCVLLVRRSAKASAIAAPCPHLCRLSRPLLVSSAAPAPAPAGTSGSSCTTRRPTPLSVRCSRP